MLKNIYIMAVLACCTLIICALLPVSVDSHGNSSQPMRISRTTSERSGINEPFDRFDESEFCDEFEEEAGRPGYKTAFVISKFCRPEDPGVNIFLQQLVKSNPRHLEQRNNYALLPCLRSIRLRR